MLNLMKFSAAAVLAAAGAMAQSVILLEPVSQPLVLQPLQMLAQAPAPLAPAAPPMAMRPGRSYLGVGVLEVDSARAKELKLKEERGVVITAVDEEGPAAKAGLKEGDVVLEYNAQRVEGVEQFIRFVRETPPGREVKLLVSRAGSNQVVAARIAANNNAAYSISIAPVPNREDIERMVPSVTTYDIPRPAMAWASRTIGIEGEALTGDLAQFFGVKEGVLVRSVVKDSSAAKGGVKVGDVITKVNNEKITSPRQISSALRTVEDNSKTVALVVMRERKETTLNLQVDAEPAPKPRTRSVTRREFRF
jgi:serine protease Do